MNSLPVSLCHHYPEVTSSLSEFLVGYLERGLASVEPQQGNSIPATLHSDRLSLHSRWLCWKTEERILLRLLWELSITSQVHLQAVQSAKHSVLKVALMWRSLPSSHTHTRGESVWSLYTEHSVKKHWDPSQSCRASPHQDWGFVIKCTLVWDTSQPRTLRIKHSECGCNNKKNVAMCRWKECEIHLLGEWPSLAISWLLHWNSFCIVFCYDCSYLIYFYELLLFLWCVLLLLQVVSGKRAEIVSS